MLTVLITQNISIILLPVYYCITNQIMFNVTQWLTMCICSCLHVLFKL